jgi:murein tripeptide amidase MpaA
MVERGGFIVSIKTSKRVDFDKLSGTYNIDVFQHSASFDGEKQQFIVDALVNLETIGQLVRDGYVVEVKAYHLAQGLQASEIVKTKKWLKEVADRYKVEEKKAKGKKGKGKDKKARQAFAGTYAYWGGESIPARMYLDYNSVKQALLMLQGQYPNYCSGAGSALKTHEGRDVPVLFIHGGEINVYKPQVLLIGGLHAREFVNPDILVNFAMDLLFMYQHYFNYDLIYGNTVFTGETIRRIIKSLKIYIMPLANPDGRVYAMNSMDLWRMNRNPNGGRTCSGSTCPDGVKLDGKGVDCNRNFDFLWNSGIHTTTNPCDCNQLYKGTSPFSEPETQAIRWTLDTFANLRYLVDLHSYRQAVLHPWQIDENQVTDINMNFKNPAYDGQRGHLYDTYKEYIPQDDLNQFATVAERVKNVINSVRGSQYTAGNGAPTIYPASATSMDYAYSRHIVDPANWKIMPLAIETGRMFNPVNPENGVQVPPDEKWLITKEISAGLVEYLKWAAGI